MDQLGNPYDNFFKIGGSLLAFNRGGHHVREQGETKDSESLNIEHEHP